MLSAFLHGRIVGQFFLDQSMMRGCDACSKLSSDRSQPRTQLGSVQWPDEGEGGHGLLGHLPLVGRFHQRIIALGGDEFIDQFLEMLRAPLIRQQFGIIFVPGRKDESLAEHREIVSDLTVRGATGCVRPQSPSGDIHGLWTILLLSGAGRTS